MPKSAGKRSSPPPEWRARLRAFPKTETVRQPHVKLAVAKTPNAPIQSLQAFVPASNREYAFDSAGTSRRRGRLPARPARGGDPFARRHAQHSRPAFAALEPGERVNWDSSQFHSGPTFLRSPYSSSSFSFDWLLGSQKSVCPSLAFPMSIELRHPRLRSPGLRVEQSGGKAPFPTICVYRPAKHVKQSRDRAR